MRGFTPMPNQSTWVSFTTATTIGDMTYDDLCEYCTDPCKRNCFAEIWVESTLNLKIIHWDLRYNAYQHPDDFMGKPCEWQPKEPRKMQHWDNNLFHNSKESSICRQHIFEQLLFSKHMGPMEIKFNEHFSDYILHFQWNQVKCHKASFMITQE